jgi:hypothetical protein
MRIEWIEGRLKMFPLSASDKKQIQDTYLELFHTEMRGSCDNCYHDALIEIYIKLKPMGNFILKSGVVIVYTDGKIYTNINLTDSVASWFLKQGERNRSLFVKIKESNKVISEITESASIEIKPKQSKTKK